MKSLPVALVVLLAGCAPSGTSTPGDAPNSAAASSGSPALPAFLSGSDIPQTVVGKTLASTTKRGMSYTMKLNGDGTGTNLFAGKTPEQITWEVKGDVLCFNGKMSGTECNRLRRAGTGLDFVDSNSGRTNNIYTVQ